MCSDGVKEPAKRVNYRNAFHGLYRIAVDEGLKNVFRGTGVTVLRSVVMNASQLSWWVSALRASRHLLTPATT
jgi:hypothetical protein